jgi:hypothetical protein
MLGRRVTITQVSPNRFRVCHAGMCLYASEPYTGLYQERLAQLVERDMDELLGEAS